MPALLLAVVGVLAVAVVFFVVPRVQDQTARVDTASDAAALAAAREHRDAFVQVLAGNSGLHLGLLQSFQTTEAASAAQRYAQANGAEVRDVDFAGFDESEFEWRYQVSTRASDSIEGPSGDVRAEGTSTAAVRVTDGICRDEETGVLGWMWSGCLTPDDVDLVCAPPPPTPTTPTEAPGPTDPPTTTPPPTPDLPENLDGVPCPSGGDLLGLLEFEVVLVE